MYISSRLRHAVQTVFGKNATILRKSTLETNKAVCEGCHSQHPVTLLITFHGKGYSYCSPTCLEEQAINTNLKTIQSELRSFEGFVTAQPCSSFFLEAGLLNTQTIDPYHYQ